MEKSDGKKSTTYSRRDFLKGAGRGALGVAVIPDLLAHDVSTVQTKKGRIPLYTSKQITLTVNEKPFSLVVEPRETLLNVLRGRLNLTGAKKICDRGECGGCTVLLDGAPIYSCMFLAIGADRKKTTTVEGLATSEKLHPVQQAFVEKDGYQCGFCTPGFIMSSVALLNQTGDLKPDGMKRGLSGNICRCGNYTKIYDAVYAAAKTMRRS
jgi:xanthine dehydrogenase YagT iron-sulfur-binding subunit